MASPETELAAGLAGLGMDPAAAAEYAAMKTPVQGVDWEAAAEAVAKALESSLERRLRKASEDFYADVLSDVQVYLRDNATFNLGQELASGRREAAEAREALSRVAEALGSRYGSFGLTPAEIAASAVGRAERLIEAERGVAAAEREALAKGLRERADWLRSEYLKGGVRAHLEPRERECRTIADMIERGRFSSEGAAA